MDLSRVTCGTIVTRRFEATLVNSSNMNDLETIQANRSMIHRRLLENLHHIPANVRVKTGHKKIKETRAYENILRNKKFNVNRS